MERLKLHGIEKDVRLNGHMVRVIGPRSRVSYEEGVREIDRLIARLFRK